MRFFQESGSAGSQKRGRDRPVTLWMGILLLCWLPLSALGGDLELMGQSVPLEVAGVPENAATTETGQILKGRITDEGGNPIARVRIEVNDRTTLSDEKGNYVLHGLPLTRSGIENLGKPFDTAYPVVQHPDYVPLMQFSLDLDFKSRVTEKDFTLKRGGIAIGRVTAKEDGRPLMGIQIQCGRDRFGSNLAIPEAITDADGRYRLTGLPHGSQLLHAFSPDWAPSMANVGIIPRKEIQQDFVLEAGKTVEGKVVDSSGNPIPNVWIVTDTWNGARMFQRETRTNSEGVFVFPHMPLTPVETDFMKEGFAAERNVELVGGREDVTVVIKGPATVSGRIVDDATGEPIRAFQLVRGIRFHQEDNRTYWEENRPQSAVSTDGRFSFTFGELSRFDLKLRFRVDGYTPTTLEDLVVKQGDHIQDLVIRMKKGDAITGVVLGPNGKPVADARVQLFNIAQPLWYSNHYGNECIGPETTTSNNGEFRITGFSDRTYNFFSEKKGVGTGFLWDVEVPNTTSTLTITLEPYGSLEGYLFQGSTPVANASIILINNLQHVNSTVQLSLKTETNDEGYFAMRNLPPMPYLCLHEMSSPDSSSNSWVRRAAVEVRSNEVSFVTLGGEGGATLSGKVTGEEGNPIPYLSITLVDWTNPNVKYYGTYSNPDGTYKIQDIPPGNYRLSGEGSQRGGGGPGNFSMQLAIDDASDLTQDIELVKKRPFAVGEVLPPLKGILDGAETVLSSLKGDRFLIGFIDPERPESYQWILEKRETIRKSGTPILILVGNMGPEKLKALIQSSELDAKAFEFESNWMTALYMKFDLTNNPPFFLVDPNGKILAFGLTFGDFQSALEGTR